MPALGLAGQSAIADLGAPGTEPASVRSAFATARLKTEQDYDSASARAQAEIKQEAGQSGMNYSPAAVSETTSLATQSIDQARSQSLRGLAFDEANSGLSQTNFLLSSLIRTGGTAASGAMGFGQGAIGAGQILSSLAQQGQQQGATYGSLIGTVAGGVLGSYFPGVGTAVGAGLGSAAGGALGGWLGGQ